MREYAKRDIGCFKKGEVVHCGECDQYMQAPEEEEVSGLRCAVPDCRHLIWAPGAKNPLPAETGPVRKRSRGRKDGVIDSKWLISDRSCFEKGAIVQCADCEAWMKAPDDEEVEGLKCNGMMKDGQKCRATIWPDGGTAASDENERWTKEADQALARAHLDLGNQWVEIAKRLPGRSNHACKNRIRKVKRDAYLANKTRGPPL